MSALPEDVFPDIRADYEAHSKACVSLRYMWLARRGGVSCPSDLDDCTDCGVTFYNEGVAWLNYDATDDEDEVRLCGCCASRRGVQLVDGPYGITRIVPTEASES